MCFNIQKEYENFINMISYSTLQVDFKKLSFVEFYIKQNTHNYLKRLWNNPPFSSCIAANAKLSFSQAYFVLLCLTLFDSQILHFFVNWRFVGTLSCQIVINIFFSNTVVAIEIEEIGSIFLETVYRSLTGSKAKI